MHSFAPRLFLSFTNTAFNTGKFGPGSWCREPIPMEVNGRGWKRFQFLASFFFFFLFWKPFSNCYLKLFSYLWREGVGVGEGIRGGTRPASNFNAVLSCEFSLSLSPIFISLRTSSAEISLGCSCDLRDISRPGWSGIKAEVSINLVLNAIEVRLGKLKDKLATSWGARREARLSRRQCVSDRQWGRSVSLRPLTPSCVRITGNGFISWMKSDRNNFS